MVAPYYFNRGWGDHYSTNYSQKEIVKAKERLIEEFSVHEDAYMKIHEVAFQVLRR